MIEININHMMLLDQARTNPCWKERDDDYGVASCILGTLSNAVADFLVGLGYRPLSVQMGMGSARRRLVKGEATASVNEELRDDPVHATLTVSTDDPTDLARVRAELSSLGVPNSAVRYSPN